MNKKQKKFTQRGTIEGISPTSGDRQKTCFGKTVESSVAKASVLGEQHARPGKVGQPISLVDFKGHPIRVRNREIETQKSKKSTIINKLFLKTQPYEKMRSKKKKSPSIG